LLAGLGAELWELNCQFLVPPLEQRTGPRPDFLKEADKYQRLRSAKILLNLHRTTSSALEWMRFLEAICNGCVVVSEPCLDGEPLVPGEHFVAANVEEIPAAINRLLHRPDQLRLMRERAYDFVREQLPMAAAAHRLIELAAELPRQPPGQRVTPPPAAEISIDPQPPADAQTLDGNLAAPPADKTIAHRLLRSILARLPRNRDTRIATQTPAYARAKPRVTVLLVATPTQESGAVAALASAAASRYDALELLVLGDSTSGRRTSATGSFLDAHPSLPALLLRQDADRGLGHSLNTLAARARGEFLFILDPTGGIYPSTLERLVDALDADPEATFAYPMVGAFDGSGPVDLLSSLPWEPERLARGNWIDPIALIRRRLLIELGGYTTDPSLAGWEAFDLWCKCAEADGHGVHIPQILAWHQQAGGLSATVNDDEAEVKWMLMREHFPRLLTA
jgi:hypothetical protein